MHLIIGLGPIGGNVGANLIDKGHGVRLRPGHPACRPVGGGNRIRALRLRLGEDRLAHGRVGARRRTAREPGGRRDAIAAGGDRPAAERLHQHHPLPTDARKITSSAPENWRVFEAPVSGGPQGARSGSLTIVLAGPQPTDAEASLLADESGHLFHLDSYGQPATVKLLNNTLATYNLAATARMLNLAAEHDVPAQKFIDVVAVSTGRSWMSDNLVDVQYDLLLKDVGLLRDELGELPVLDLAGNVEEQILTARKNLESAGS